MISSSHEKCIETHDSQTNEYQYFVISGKDYEAN